MTVGALEKVVTVTKERWCSTKMTSTQPIITEPYVPLKEALHSLISEHEGLEKEWSVVREQAEEVLTRITSVERKKKALESLIATRVPEKEEVKPVQPRKRKAPISDEVKALVRQAIVEEGRLTWRQASELYKISESSVRRIVNEARAKKKEEAALPLGEEPTTAPTKRKRGRKPKLDGEEILLILDWLEEDSTLTLKQLCARIERDFGKKIGKSTLNKAFHDLSISYKEVVDIPARWNADEVLLTRQHYVREAVREHIGRPLVFLDECPFNLHLHPARGRALRGEPALLSALPKQQNITLIASLSLSGILFSKFIASHEKGKRGVNADDFRLFLLDLKPRLPAGALLLLDNASIHHTNAVHETLALLRADGFDFLFLPPYSPFLNPIEYAFAKIKRFVRQATFYNRGELQRAIVEALATITTADVQQWFAHMVKYFHQCALGLPFRGKPLAPHLFAPLPSASSSDVGASLHRQWEAFARGGAVEQAPVLSLPSAPPRLALPAPPTAPHQ